MNSLRARIRIPENRKLIPYKKGKKNRKKNLTMLKRGCSLFCGSAYYFVKIEKNTD